MYVYLQPCGGLNDILCCTERCLQYCRKYNRILLLDTYNTTYKINFSDYFTFSRNNIICDFNEIKKILKENNNSIYPNFLTSSLILNTTKLIILRYSWRELEIDYKGNINGYIVMKINKICDLFDKIKNISADLKIWKTRYNNSNNNKKKYILNLPNKPIKEKIIFFGCDGGGNGYQFFKNINFKKDIKSYCQEKYLLIKKPYLSIQIRNTDYQCDYQNLYNVNREKIHSYQNIYVATDDVNVITFFKSKSLNIYNFTTFPKEEKYRSLHTSNVDSKQKIYDLILDVYMITMSDQLLSNSKGGFIKLCRSCNENKDLITTKFEIK